MTAMWPLADDEYYVSIDIEADGPAPGLNSMLSLGAAAFTADGALVDTFSANTPEGSGSRPRPPRRLARSRSARGELDAVLVGAEGELQGCNVGAG